METGEQTKSQTRKKRIFMVAMLFIIVLAIVIFMYTNVYYHAQVNIESILETHDVIVEQKNGYLLCTPDGQAAKTGYVFYPGGKVEAAAYLPYVAKIAGEGYVCAIIEPVFYLAILNTSAAEKPIAAHPEVENWAVGGHSLGGVAAADFARKNPELVQGLVLLASYPNVDLSGMDLKAVSITATQDQILNWEKYRATQTDLPGQTELYSIEGGNHGQFGAYGAQKGDGTPVVGGEEQQEQTAALTLAFLEEL